MYPATLPTIPDPRETPPHFEVTSATPKSPLEQHHSIPSSRPNPRFFKQPSASQPTILPHWGDYLNPPSNLQPPCIQCSNSPHHSTSSHCICAQNQLYAQTITIHARTYHLQSLPSFLSHVHSSQFPLQISKSLLDSSIIPGDPCSALLQDQVRLGQSNLIPQVAVKPSEINHSLQSQFIHLRDANNEAFPSQNPRKGQISHHIAITSAPDLAPSVSPHIINSPTNQLHTAQVYQSTTHTHNANLKNVDPSNPTFDNPSRSTTSPAKSSPDGFFFSDDTIVHSLLPNFTPKHATPTIASTISSSGAVLPGSNPLPNVSTLPLTQQHLPDQIIAYNEPHVGLSSQFNRDGEYPWVTPAISVAWDAHKRLSLLTSAHGTVLNKKLSCLHRTQVPSFLSAIFFSCIKRDLKVTSIQPSKESTKIQQKLLSIVQSYETSTSSPSQTSPRNAGNTATSSDQSHQHPPRPQSSFLTSFLTSIRTAFSTPLSIKKHENMSIPAVFPNNDFSLKHKYDPGLPHPQRLESQQIELALAPFQVFNSIPVEQIAFNELEIAGKGNPTDANRPMALYTNNLAPNPVSVSTVTASLERQCYSDGTKEMLAKSSKIKRTEANAIATNTIVQPFAPLFDTLATNHLFTYNSKNVTIFPLSSTITSMASAITNPFHNKLPTISFAHLLAPCFPRCIVTPYNVIKRVNKVAFDRVTKSYHTYRFLHDYHEERIKRGLGVKKIRKDILNDIHLQIASTGTSLNWDADYHTFTEFTMDYFQAIAQTPLLYFITPVAMAYLIQFWITGDAIDFYSVFQALIRWSIYHVTQRFQNHQQTCHWLKERRQEYLQIVEYSLNQYKIAQNGYFTQLQAYNNKVNPSRDDGRKVKSKKDKMDIKSEKTEVELQSPANKIPASNPPKPKVPISPLFSLQIPPELQKKYESQVDFLNTQNPCEFCHRFQGIQVVYKPWTQPNVNSASSAIHEVPSTIHDMNFYNIPSYHGFSSLHTTSSPLYNTNHLATRYDLASGRASEQFGHFLSFSPKLANELIKAPPSVQLAVSNPSNSEFHTPPTVNSNSAAFTSVFLADMNGIPQNTPQSPQSIPSPTPPNTQTSNHHSIHINSNHSTFPSITSKASPQFSEPYGLHIPSALIRKDLAPLLQIFPFATFTSSQLSTLFSQPSIFTPFEQFYILSSRTIPSGALPTSSFSPTLTQTSNLPSHPYYAPFVKHGIIREPAALNPHYGMSPFNTFGQPGQLATYDPSRRFICPLFENQPLPSLYYNELRLEMGKGFFARATNPQFNAHQTVTYSNLISSLMYELYLSRVTPTTGANQPSVAAPGTEGGPCGGYVDEQFQQTNAFAGSVEQQGHRATSSGKSSMMFDKLPTADLNLQNPYLKSFYTKYHHELRNSLQSLPGYRDGLFSLSYTSTAEKIEPAFPTKLSMQDNLKFKARFADTASYTVAFPRPFDIYPSPQGIHSYHYTYYRFPSQNTTINYMARWIGGEYLLNTQQFTKNVVLEEATLYPYLQCHQTAHPDAQSVILKQQIASKSPQQRQTTHNSNNNIYLETNSTSTPSSPAQYYNNSTLLQPPETGLGLYDPAFDFALPEQHELQKQPDQHSQQNQPQPIPNQHYYQDSQTPLPVDLPIILGTMFNHEFLTTNVGAMTGQSYKYNPTLEPYYCFPHTTIIWNWFIAPYIGIAAFLASLIILGFVYQQTIEPSPVNLIPILIFGIIYLLYPFLMWLQRSFQAVGENGHIWGFENCCGLSARRCHPQMEFKSEPTYLERFAIDVSFEDDWETDTFPSIGRFCSAVGIFWACLAIYLKLSGLVDLSINAMLIPIYVIHGIQLFAGWHKVGSVNIFEFSLTLSYIISLGVLHGAIADPSNMKYNGVAVLAPFLVPIAGCILFWLWFIFDNFVCDDDECDTEVVVISIICWFLLFVYCFWVAFSALIIQELIRPEAGWWTPPYWAAHSVTFIMLIMIIVLAIRESKYEDRSLPGGTANHAPRTSHLMDDVSTGDALWSKGHFFPGSVENFELSRYDQSRDVMTRL